MLHFKTPVERLVFFFFIYVKIKVIVWVRKEDLQMRILSITAQKPDSTGSGVYMTELVKGFQKLGHEQAVICGVLEEDKIFLPEGVACFPYYYKTDELPFAVLGMSDEMPYESTRYCDMTGEMTRQLCAVLTRHLANVIDVFCPDIILCHHLYFITSLVRELYPKKKIYAICHGSDLRQMKKNPWQVSYIKEQIVKLDGIFALHKEQREDIIATYGCESERVEVIGTGYNKDVFYVQNTIDKSDDRTQLIFAGKISEKKGVMSLIRALSYLEDVENRYVLALAGGAGNQAEFDEIQRLAADSPCEVRFLGRLSHQELAKELNSSDIFILPSFFEGLPLVIIEAMACGLHVVCTDLPGIRTWMEATLPQHCVTFVKPPKMRNADEPVEEELSAFEKELAEVILIAKEKPIPKMTDVQKLSWEGLCQTCVQMFGRAIM